MVNDSLLSRVSYLSETNGSGTRYAAYTYLGHGQIVRVDCNKISDNDPTHSCNLAFGTDNDPYDGLDQFGRAIDLRWTNYAGTTDLVGIKHGYDRSGNRLWRRDVVSAAQETPVYLDERYIYDGMYQLVALRRGQLTAAEDALVAGSEEFAEQWTLDQLGNWSNVKSDDDGDGDWDLDQARTHNKANEIATITGEDVEVAHDAAGNMTVAPKPEDWGDHYHFIYDPWNRLVEVQTADQTKMVRAYEYDGLDRMISKWSYDEDAFSLSEWRHYYYSDQWQFLEERVADSYTGSYSGSGIPAMSGWGLSGSGIAGTFRLDRQFVWGLQYVNDLVLRDRDTDTNGSLDERIYALQDPNWNVVAIANTSGVIQERYTYTAYGKPSFLTLAFAVRNPDVSSYSWETLFCGYRYDYHTDSDVKWHIAGHRILLSHLGRWNRRDPMEDEYDPYRYCGNGPLTRTDPTGLFWPFSSCACDCKQGDKPTEGKLSTMEVLAVPLDPDRNETIQGLFLGVQGLETIDAVAGVLIAGIPALAAGIAESVESLVTTADSMIAGQSSGSGTNLRPVIEAMQGALKKQKGYRVFLKVTWKECEPCGCLWGEPGYEYNEHSCWQTCEAKRVIGFRDDIFGGSSGQPHFTIKDFGHCKKQALDVDGCRAKAIRKAQ